MQPLIPHFIQQKYKEDKELGSFDAYVMFVDMSGFTPLTATLMKQGTIGAERLSNILNDIFSPMVSRVYERGGYIPYFAGDAFTAVFPLEASEEHAKGVLCTAQELLVLLDKARKSFPEFPIGVKIGVGFGQVEWGIVGKENKTFYFRGAGIEASIQAEKKTKEGQVVFDATIREQLRGKIGKKIEENDFFLLSESFNSKDFHWEKTEPLEQIEREVALKFLPESVLTFNQRAEFRTVVSVFISFEGVESHDELNEFVAVVLENLYSFSGYFKEIEFGDKGGVLLGFFGAPVSYENNIERALKFLLNTQSDLLGMQDTGHLKIRAGMTSGIAYAGIVGGPERIQYAAVGNTVNLAARLMVNADWGDILVDAEMQKDANFKYKYKGEIRYKGFEEPIPTYKVAGRNVEKVKVYEGDMVGRKDEMDRLLSEATLSFSTERAKLAYAFGEAGIGKTRLAYEFKTSLEKQHQLRWFTCRSDQILRKPFNPFVFFLKNYFEQSPENTPKENRDSFERRFQWLVRDFHKMEGAEAFSIRRELIRTKGVLAALIDIKLENSIWDNLDAKGRYQNTLAALSNLILAETLIQPIVLELEDGHWFDDNSREFLAELISRIKNKPAFILVTSRYDDEGNRTYLFDSKLLEKLDVTEVILDLNILKPEALKEFAEARLGGSINVEFFEFLQRTTNGNPFYLEQILEYFIESNLLEKEGELWTIKDKNIRISNSINAVLTARIDRLSSLVKETVKAAAVIGREFELPVLTEVMRAQASFIQKNGDANKVLKEQIQSAERGQIWQAMNELRYIFRHSLLREAVYDMQLRERVRELHKLIAKAIEKIYANDLEPKYVDLAFHYEQAEVEDKTKEYLEKAADLTKDLYQNQQALRFYDKLLLFQQKNKEELEEIRTFLKKGSILELIGEWEECEKVYDEALTKARTTDDLLLIGRCNNSLGYLLMLKGNYEDANMYLEAAAAFFEAIQDMKGISKVYGNLGNLYFRQGNYEDAKSHFIRSIQMSELYEQSSSNAQIVANLGLTYMNIGNYDDAIRWQRSQLEICKQLHDKQGMATLYTNMGIVYFERGDLDNALLCYEKGLALSEELGNKLLTSIAIGSLGRVYERKGDYDKAMHLFEDDLKISEELGDKQGISIALGLIGDLHSVRGEFPEAIRFMEQNLAISEELGYQKGIAKAVNTLGDVYFYKNDYDKALEYYNRAITVTRGIGNKLVLGSSLVEKATVLTQINKTREAQDALNEAISIANELGNPDLIFDSKLMSAKVARVQGKEVYAIQILKDLLSKRPEKGQEAAIFFEWSKMGDNEDHKKKALRLYEELYAATPHVLFKLRIDHLKT